MLTILKVLDSVFAPKLSEMIKFKSKTLRSKFIRKQNEKKLLILFIYIYQDCDYKSGAKRRVEVCTLKIEELLIWTCK